MTFSELIIIAFLLAIFPTAIIFPIVFFFTAKIVPKDVEDSGEDREHNEDDYWDGAVNYDTGEIDSDSGPTIRHPKNRNRAYSGSA